MFLRVGDQLSGGALDVLGLHDDGGFRLSGDRQVTELPVFAGDVPGVVEREGPVPASAAATHLRRHEAQFIAVNATLLTLAAIVAWARFGPYSL